MGVRDYDEPVKHIYGVFDMTKIFEAANYDPSAVTRKTVEFSEVSGRKPWIIREFVGVTYVRATRTDGSEIPSSVQDAAKRYGAEVGFR